MDRNDLFFAMIVSSSIKIFLTLIIAAVLIYFGYRLFYLAETKAGNLELESKFGKIRLIRATPGIFLTFFGTAILIVGLFKGSSIESDRIKLSGSFGSVAAQSQDFKRCAREVYWAISEIKGSTTYSGSTGPARTNVDKHLESLQLVLAQCVDSTVGAGAYAKYRVVQLQMDGGGTVNASTEENDAYRDVSDLLGS